MKLQRKPITLSLTRKRIHDYYGGAEVEKDEEEMEDEEDE